jgi:hypothetical protein
MLQGYLCGEERITVLIRMMEEEVFFFMDEGALLSSSPSSLQQFTMVEIRHLAP